MAEAIEDQGAHESRWRPTSTLYPLVTMDVTRRQLTNVPEAEGIHGPMNTFVSSAHSRRRT